VHRFLIVKSFHSVILAELCSEMSMANILYESTKVSSSVKLYAHYNQNTMGGLVLMTDNIKINLSEIVPH